LESGLWPGGMQQIFKNLQLSYFTYNSRIIINVLHQLRIVNNDFSGMQSVDCSSPFVHEWWK